MKNKIFIAGGGGYVGTELTKFLANKGYEKALKEDKNFLAGLNVFKGEVTYKAVADIFGHKYTSPADIIGA